MNFGFLILPAVVVVVVAVLLPVVLKQIAGNKPVTAANLPYRKQDYQRPVVSLRRRSLHFVQDDSRGGGRLGEASLPLCFFAPLRGDKIREHPCASVAKNSRDKLSPVLVIELDKATHEEEARRDPFTSFRTTPLLTPP